MLSGSSFCVGIRTSGAAVGTGFNCLRAVPSEPGAGAIGCLIFGAIAIFGSARALVCSDADALREGCVENRSTLATGGGALTGAGISAGVDFASRPIVVDAGTLGGAEGLAAICGDGAEVRSGCSGWFTVGCKYLFQISVATMINSARQTAQIQIRPLGPTSWPRLTLATG